MKQLKVVSSIIMPILIITVVALMTVNEVVAKDAEISYTPEISFSIESTQVDRAEVLRTFLQKYNSPMVDNVDTFILVADKYGLDYRLLPAISCMESTCGHRLIPGTYNAWGWGIYGKNVISFESFDEGIERVGKGIYEGYVLKGLDTPRKMAPVYTPPRSGHWLSGVTTFMNQMDNICEQLSIIS